MDSLVPTRAHTASNSELQSCRRFVITSAVNLTHPRVATRIYNRASSDIKRAAFTPRLPHNSKFLLNSAEPRSIVAKAQKQRFTSFDDVVNASPIVLVDFYATWCGPCVMQANAIDEASRAMKGSQVKFIKIDTEKYPQLASRFNVSGLPTLMLFKNGKPVARQEGMLTAADLQRWIGQVTAN